MGTATIRELRNHGGEVIDRVAGGEHVVVTRDGKSVAELRPLQRRPLSAGVLIERFKNLPPVEPQRLRDDVDALLDTSLRRSGRKTTSRALDAMIAAAAIANDLALYTLNPKGFEGIDGLEVIEIAHPHVNT